MHFQFWRFYIFFQSVSGDIYFSLDINAIELNFEHGKQVNGDMPVVRMVGKSSTSAIPASEGYGGFLKEGYP